MAENTTTRISTKQPVKFTFTPGDFETTYPSEWFRKHPNEKPSVTIPKTDSSEEEILKSIVGGIKSSMLSLDTIKIFLYNYSNNIKETSDDQWKSFKITIAERGQETTPFSILFHKEGTEHTPNEPLVSKAGVRLREREVDPIEWTERACALYIFCVYRLVKINDINYTEQLIKRMEEQLAAEGGAGMSLHGVSSIYGAWLNDRTFLRIVAAYDMFLNKFRDHPDSILRLGTLGSRFRDCAGIISFGYAMTILNIQAAQLMDWIFMKTMADEMERMSQPGQELSDKFSYFPYQSDMGLVLKSPYSSNANPYLFHWIHIIGSILGHKRSINARFYFEGSYADVTLNAVMVCWVYARGGGLEPQFDRAGEEYWSEIVAETPEEEGQIELTPEDRKWLAVKGRNPKTWYALLRSSGYQVPGIVRTTMKRQSKKIGEVRDDSVGDYVKNRMTY